MMPGIVISMTSTVEISIHAVSPPLNTGFARAAAGGGASAGAPKTAGAAELAGAPAAGGVSGTAGCANAGAVGPTSNTNASSSRQPCRKRRTEAQEKVGITDASTLGQGRSNCRIRFFGFRRRQVRRNDRTRYVSGLSQRTGIPAEQIVAHRRTPIDPVI
jgi:hypothetical protein